VDAGVFTLINFSLGSQPVCQLVTALETTMFGMEIGSNGNMLMTLLLMLMCGRPVIDSSLFMQSFCSMYDMRRDVPPLENGNVDFIMR
jgi:hypothetical protein